MVPPEEATEDTQYDIEWRLAEYEHTIQRLQHTIRCNERIIHTLEVANENL